MPLFESFIGRSHGAIVYLFCATASCAGVIGQPLLLWADEFDVDGPPDPNKWIYDVGGDGWGNQEAQYYTDGRPENARVENGSLIIEARAEGWPPGRSPTNDYTSARLLTKGQGDWRYGRIEIRAKIPAGRGTWPGIWMLSTGNSYGPWPRSGEIDIMEHVGFDPGKVHGSLHSFGNNWLTGTQPTDSTTVADFDTAFHTYTIDWFPDRITFYVDDVPYLTGSNPNTDWEDWPFDQPFHLILNLAVGGTWGGQQGIDPDVWPARLEVDYVRVYDLGDTPLLDTDGDGDPNVSDPDDDNDGLTDKEEHLLGTSILAVDTDGDGYSDAEEVEAGTYPLLRGSFPGSIASILTINNDFAYGEEPWIVHTNFQDAGGNWLGQAGSWGGVYTVFNFVAPTLSGDITFHSFNLENTPRAEHLLYQEWSPRVIELRPGDVVRFRGNATAALADETLIAEAFIRVLDASFQPTSAGASLVIDDQTGAFELETILPPESFNVLQVGFLLKGPQTTTGTITFRDLEATLNEDDVWAGWPVANGIVDTGDWLGPLYVGSKPWIWSFNLGTWMYLRADRVRAKGAWAYVVRATN